jgi:hypothetical protein
LDLIERFIKRVSSSLVAPYEKKQRKMRDELLELEKEWVSEQINRYGSKEKIPQSEWVRWRDITKGFSERKKN